MKFRLIIDEDKDEEIVATVHQRSSLIDEIEALILSHTGTDSILGCWEDEWRVLPFSEIECITTVNGKVYAIDTKGKQYRLRQRLYELEAQLPGYFIRINKSTLANEKRLDHLRAAYSGGVDAVFKCGYQDYVSRRCFSQIKRRFEGK